MFWERAGSGTQRSQSGQKAVKKRAESGRKYCVGLGEKALRKMSVRVKLKDLTTYFIVMGVNYVASLIQVPCDTQTSKNWFQV